MDILKSQDLIKDSSAFGCHISLTFNLEQFCLFFLILIFYFLF